MKKYLFLAFLLFPFLVGADTANIQVEAIGAGGNTGQSTLGGIAGGGGGAYSKLNAFLATDGVTYTVTVGASNGADSWFDSTGSILAKGGSSIGDNVLTGGVGGQASSGVGDTKYNGGDGGNGTGGSNGSQSGSGGGGAGSTGAGGNGSTSDTPGTGTSLYGGNGGVGNHANNSNGSNGSTYGGGSGGASRSSGTRSGGSGAGGVVIITVPTGTVSTSTYAGGTFSQAGGNDIWTFTTTGTWTPTIPTPDTLGCTDPEADNYNPDATVDDESCTYGGDTGGGTTSAPYNGPNKKEFYFFMGVFLFFISLTSWGYIFGPAKKS